MDQTLVQTSSASLPFRRAMVDNQVRTFDVTDQPLLDRFYTVPREMFLPADLASLAYSDAVLTVGPPEARRPQLIPMVLARLLQGASLQPSDRVLLVGAGTGYAAAILAGLVAEVVSLETDPTLAEQTTRSVKSLGLTNVEAVTGNLAEGHASASPYSLVVIAGAVESNLDALLSQLAPEGRLVALKKMAFDGVRRSGKAVIYQRFGSDVSMRTLFDAPAPVLEAFLEPAAFVF